MKYKANHLIKQALIKEIEKNNLDKIPTQKDLAKQIQTDYSKVNLAIREMIESGEIKAVKVGRKVKYLTQYQIDQNLSFPLDIRAYNNINITKEIKNIYNNNIIKEIEDNILISIKDMSNFVKSGIRKIPKKLIRGRLYYFIDGKKLTLQKLIDIYVQGKRNPEGKRFRGTGRTRSLKYFYSPILKSMIFNVDFSQVHEVTEDVLLNVERFYQIAEGSYFENINKGGVVYLMRKYGIMPVITKIIYLSGKLKTVVGNPFKYLQTCLINMQTNESEEFFEISYTKSDKTVWYPKLYEFWRYFKTSLTVKEMFEKYTQKFERSEIWENFYRLWNPDDLIIKTVADTVEGY